MDSKSKLPKPSTSRLPLSSAKQNIRPQITKMNGPKIKPQLNSMKLCRRSKSMTDLRGCLFQPTSKPTIGVKRPASSKTDLDANLKIKQPKIPDWDYKSRFQVLNEKHKKILEAFNKLKEDSTEYEEVKQKYNVKIAEQLTEIQQLKEFNQKLEIDNEKLNSEKVAMTHKIQEVLLESQYLQESLNEKNNECNELKLQFAKFKEDHINSEFIRRRLHNTIQDLKGNIRVFCRVRPPITEQEKEKPKCCINYVDENTMDIRNNKEISSSNVKSSDTTYEFNFDQIFTEDSTQAHFFEELSQLIQSALDGYNVCVFAYGQTGSGKTYTMQGLDYEAHLGMIPRSVNLIFSSIENLRQYNWKYEVKVSFLEIYNEHIRDLLDHNANHTLDILYNEGRGTTVTNLKIESISSYEEFNDLMKLAQKHRMVAATDFNEHSSRSHAITKIYLTGINEENKLIYCGSVNLVDLAGSESAKTSKGARLVETKSINKSLSALGSVMLALHNKDKHVPYRNSKLTYLLQSSLGGNSKTLMIVNISPFEDTLAESINSLRFASKVKEVRTKVKRNKLAPME